MYAQPLNALNKQNLSLITTPKDSASDFAAIKELIELRFIANLVKTESLGNEVADLLYDHVKRTSTFPTTEEASYIYERSTEDDKKIRDLVVQCLCYKLFGEIGDLSMHQNLTLAKRQEWRLVMEEHTDLGRDLVLKMASWGVSFKYDLRKRELPLRCSLHAHLQTPKCAVNVVSPRPVSPILFLRRFPLGGRSS